MLKRTSCFLLNTAKNKVENSAKGSINLYFWKPYPETIVGISNKPLLAHSSGGLTGHISMGINYSNGENFHVSIFPLDYYEIHEGGLKLLRPIINSDSLEKDKAQEGNREPMVKNIEINADQEKKIIESCEKLSAELEKNPLQREQWSPINNCAHYVANILYEANVIYQKPFLATPEMILNLVDELEKAAYLENLNKPSFKD